MEGWLEEYNNIYDSPFYFTDIESPCDSFTMIYSN